MQPSSADRLRLVGLAAGILLLVASCATAAPAWTYVPAPSTTPIPSSAPSGGASAGPSEAASSAPSPEASASASGASSAAPSGGTATVLNLVAAQIAFNTKTLDAPANAPFEIVLNNQDAGTPHDVTIKDASGAQVFKDSFVTGPATKTYNIPALPAGTYTFYCSIHPIPAMTGTLTIH